jgi:hypothetical protein
MANTSQVFSSSEINTSSEFLSAIEAETVSASASTSASTSASASASHTTHRLRIASSIHKHCRTATKEEKTRIKKIYFYKYYPPQNTQGHHASTVGLQGHLQKHNIQ